LRWVCCSFEDYDESNWSLAKSPRCAAWEAAEKAADLMPEHASAWAKAEILARRIYDLTTVPMRSENHPTWDPTWRAAIDNGLRAIGTGDEATMERALIEIEKLAKTL
jgi:hypothetical protein